MALADRLYELACECRDKDTSYDAVLRDVRRKEELLEAFKRAAGELLEALEDARLSGAYPPPAGVASCAADLRNLIA